MEKNMKCPTCHHSISPFKVLLITRWTSIKCNKCGTCSGRALNLQFWFISALLIIPLALLKSALNLQFLVWMLIVMFIDAYTITLVPKRREEK
jgi:hypothetical protein